MFVDEVTVSAGGGGAAIAGDLNGDGEVNVSDLLALLAACGSSADGDCNSDGVTDVSDLLILLSNFGS